MRSNSGDLSTRRVRGEGRGYHRLRTAVSLRHWRCVHQEVGVSICFVYAMPKNLRVLCRRGSSSWCIRTPTLPCFAHPAEDSPTQTRPSSCIPIRGSSDCLSLTSSPPVQAPYSTVPARFQGPAVCSPPGEATVDNSKASSTWAILSLWGTRIRGLP